MTEEEKQLLIKDLCGRLPYFVEAQVVNTIEGESKPLTISKELTFSDVESFANCGVVCNIKPYLRPLTNWYMTADERIYLLEELGFDADLENGELNDFGSYVYRRVNVLPLFDWLNAHHFDYRGLIEKGLALEAPEGMYKTE